MATTKKTDEAEAKPTTVREDPLVRAQREFQEKVERIKANAEKQLENAREELAASERNVTKAVKVRDERKARVEALERQAAGTDVSAANGYAAALGAQTIDVVED